MMNAVMTVRKPTARPWGILERIHRYDADRHHRIARGDARMTTWTTEQLQSIHRMLNPSSIAVVGATPRLQYGGRFLRAALQAGDRIRVYPVNPRYDEIMGLKSYPSLQDVPDTPD